MKKKILLFIAIISAFVCLFAISSSAKGAYLEEIPAHLKGSNDQAQYFIVFDGEEYYKNSAAPREFELYGLNTETIAAQVAALSTEHGEDIESLIGTKYLTKFIFPETMGENKAEITYLYLNHSELKRTKYFNGVCGAIVIPSTVSTIGDMNETTSQLRSIEFPVDTKITAIPECFARYAEKLREIKNFPRYLPGGISTQAFCNCYYAFSGELYLNATNINNKAFDNALSQVTGITFGPLTTTLANESLSVDAQKKLGSQIKYLEFECDITMLNINVSDNSCHGAFYFGLDSGSQREPLANLECIILSHPAQADTPAGTTFQSFFSYDVYFNTNAENIVTTSHNWGSTSMSYLNGYQKNGEKTSVCQDCEKAQATTLPAIFTPIGYATRDNGTGILCDYRINVDALSEYNEYLGEENELIFGIFLANANTFGDSFIGADGKITTEKGIQLQMTSNDYTKITASVIGFEEAHRDLELVICMYVIDSSGIKYIQSATEFECSVTKNGVTLFGATIGEISALANNLNQTQPDAILPNDDE